MKNRYGISNISSTIKPNDVEYTLTSSSGEDYYNYDLTSQQSYTDDHVSWVTTTTEVDSDIYPKLPNALGVIYVDKDEIKCRTPEGNDIILGKLDESDNEISLNIVATIAKKLLENK